MTPGQPCDRCPIGPRCRGLVHARDCVNVARGVPGYPEMLRRLAGLEGEMVPRPLPPRRSPAGSPVRVGFASPCLYLGGAEVWHETLLAHLDRSRVEPVGMAVADPAAVWPPMAARIRRYCPVTFGAAAIRDLADRVDVLACWGLARVEVPTPGPIVVAVSHGQGASGWTQGLLGRLAPQAHRFVAVSDPAIEALPAARRADVAVIPNGVDRKRLVPRASRAATRRRWDVYEGMRVLGYLGRMSDEKDPHALIRTMRHMPPGWVGVAVGDGYNFAAFRHQAKESGRVLTPGPTEDVGGTLAAFDALLVPSREDGFCLVMVEGWACGVPVVSTPVGVAIDHPDLVRPVPIDDDGRAIAAAVLADAADPIGTRERCRRARKVARERYSAECFAAGWAAYLESLVGIAPSAQP